jgi:Tfp pilus assembly protein PilO
MPRSSGERLWWIAGVLGAFVLILIGWFFLISPQRSSTSNVDNQVAAARQRNAGLQSRIDSLRAQNAQLAKYQASLHRAQLALPSESGLSDFLRTLQAIGTHTSTDVQALTVGAPVAITAPTTTPGNPAATTTAPAAPAAGTPPAATGTGVYGLPISAQVTGSPAALGQFLQQLQAVQPRAVLITKLLEGTGPVAGGGSATTGTTLQLTMQAFVAPAATPVAVN